VESLNVKLARSVEMATVEPVSLDSFDLGLADSKLEQAKLLQQSTINLQKLFDGLRFFLGREVPRKSLTFIIRACGGQVSWSAQTFAGSAYKEEDVQITHQIVDRPSVEMKYLNRRYIQPQWVYDCINARTLLPVNNYLPGAILPPHLSPFVIEERAEQHQDNLLLSAEKGISKTPIVGSKNASRRVYPAIVSEGKVKSQNPQVEIDRLGAAKKLQENHDFEALQIGVQENEVRSKSEAEIY